MVTDSRVQAGAERDEQGCGSRLSYTGRDERGRQGTAGDGYSTAPDRKAGGSIPSRRTTLRIQLAPPSPRSVQSRQQRGSNGPLQVRGQKEAIHASCCFPL